jgi:hypothetical protein
VVAIREELLLIVGRRRVRVHVRPGGSCGGTKWTRRHQWRPGTPDVVRPEYFGQPASGGSLAALADLSAGTLDLTDMLTQVATLAVLAIPGADDAGLTLLGNRSGRPDRQERNVRSGDR